jgi:hypothetical protein
MIRPGTAISMNYAAVQAGGEILAFLGPDIEPTAGWIEAVERAFDRDPTLEVAVGRTGGEPTGALAAAEAALDGAVPRDGSSALGHSLHCAVRKGAFIRLGGFDEGLPPAVTQHSPLGGLLVDDVTNVGRPDDMVACRVPSADLRQFLRRQRQLGGAACYRTAQRPVGSRLAGVLRSVGGALRGIRRPWDQVQVLALAMVGAAMWVLGTLAALALGVRPDSPVPSPLVGPESQSLIADPAAEERRRATVIVPVHGQPDWVNLCFASLIRQDMAEPYEVIAVFDSQGDLSEEVGAAFPRVRLCYCRPEDGPGGARNRAIEIARGDYVLFTDDDCIAERDWVRRMVEACRERDGGPVRGWVETAYPHLYVARAFNIAERGTARPRKACTGPGIGGNNMAVGRDLLERSGARFAESVYGAEEIAFLHQLPEEHRTVLMEPASRVRHLRGETLRTSLARHYRMGWGSGWLRRQSRMRGSLFARHVWLAPFLAPLRLVLTFSRVVRWCPGRALDFLRLSPFIFCQYVFYAAGFVKGAIAARRAAIPNGPSPEEGAL